MGWSLEETSGDQTRPSEGTGPDEGTGPSENTGPGEDTEPGEGTRSEMVTDLVENRTIYYIDLKERIKC